jgi:8-oxo-dGTP pyrophosphatase MutT (NUDIX family)
MTLAERLRAALEDGARRETIRLTGDFRDHELESLAPFAPAAVLVAVTDRPDPGVLLTQRTDTLRKHPGQISFPGGRIDPEDDGPIAAALREAEEEIGLPRHLVEVIGIADRYRTGTGYDITPVVGVIPPDLALVPNDAEVAAMFEVPLSFLLEPTNHIEQAIEWQGHERHFYELTWQDRRIWGATAGMIVNLARRLAYPA